MPDGGGRDGIQALKFLLAWKTRFFAVFGGIRTEGPVNDQTVAFILNDLSGGANIDSLTVFFKARVGEAPAIDVRYNGEPVASQKVPVMEGYIVCPVRQSGPVRTEKRDARVVGFQSWGTSW